MRQVRLRLVRLAGSTPFRLIPFFAGLGTDTLTLTLTQPYQMSFTNGLGELGLGEMAGHRLANELKCVQ